MKKLILFLTLSSFALSTLAQKTKQSQDVDCYEHYYNVFHERGAYKVKDGVHEKVIVSLRTEGEAECFMGKVEVKDGAVVKMFLMFVDDTYELYDPKFKNNFPTTISKGVSRSRVTLDDEIVNVFFIKRIKPKKKKYKKAPIIHADDL